MTTCWQSYHSIIDLLHPVSAPDTSAGWSPSRMALKKKHHQDQLLSDQVQDVYMAHECS